MSISFIRQPATAHTIGLERLHAFLSTCHLSPQRLDQALKNSILAFTNPKGTLEGVTSAELVRVPHLGQNAFYQLYCIGPDLTTEHEIALLLESSKYLEMRDDPSQSDCKGLIYVLEDTSKLKTSFWRRAAWPELKMYLMAFSKSGNPIYIHYFPMARI
ncbi:MAG: hypothetical protein JST14_12550 [Bacteroidetes bacterium]|nr:hypothetical protein [Bacteroidota bacterium]